MIKDEQPYIEEWVEFHHSLGVNHFYLIEDIGSTSHADILSKYDFVEVYQFEDIINDRERQMLYDGVYRQKIVYEVFRRKWFNDNDFLLFIDVDEFIEADRESFISTLEKYSDYPYLLMRWKTMKSDGHIYHPNNHKKYSVLEAYKDFNYRVLHTKVIVNLKPEFFDITSLEHFSLFPHQFGAEVKYAWVDLELRHYLCKSFEEWVERLTNKGEIIKADWNRKFDDWFGVNPEFWDRKEELMKLFGCDKLQIKYNDFIKKD